MSGPCSVMTRCHRSAKAGTPMHTETAYLRAPSPTTLEIISGIPTGQSELCAGGRHTTDDGLTLTTGAEARCTPTATCVDRVVRRCVVRPVENTLGGHRPRGRHREGCHVDGATVGRRRIVAYTEKR